MPFDQTFAQAERSRARRWKLSTSTLPPDAKIPAPYVRKDGSSSGLHDFCIPAGYATLSLLPEVRRRALTVFDELEIPWHAGVGGGPSNHLLSSQVQCANALTQMVDEPDRLVAAFGDVLGVATPLQIEPGRFLTFEYIGPDDYFGEAGRAGRVRGSMCTSVDAAFLHRSCDGIVELVLIEWKYTESYSPRKVDPAKDAVRWRRYGPSFTNPHGPLRSDLLEFSDMLNEPLYQLMRQQLLAHHLESDHAHGAQRVRVVHVCPNANVAYQHSLLGQQYDALGEDVSAVWHALLRRPERFMSIDSGIFLDPAITSTEYNLRYGSSTSGDAKRDDHTHVELGV